MDKQKIADLHKQLRDGARAQDPASRIAVTLVKLLYEQAQESLVTAEGDDMLRLQGAARAFSKMHTELTVIPPAIPTGE